MAPEQTTTVITIPIDDDDIAEDTENLTLTLTNTSVGIETGSKSTATLEIIDNDNVVNPVNLDIDSNGQTDALTDGILAIRYLFGARDNALINNAIVPDATRTDAPSILSFLQSFVPVACSAGIPKAPRGHRWLLASATSSRIVLPL